MDNGLAEILLDLLKYGPKEYAEKYGLEYWEDGVEIRVNTTSEVKIITKEGRFFAFIHYRGNKFCYMELIPFLGNETEF